MKPEILILIAVSIGVVLLAFLPKNQQESTTMNEPAASSNAAPAEDASFEITVEKITTLPTTQSLDCLLFLTVANRSHQSLDLKEASLRVENQSFAPVFLAIANQLVIDPGGSRAVTIPFSLPPETPRGKSATFTIRGREHAIVL